MGRRLRQGMMITEVRALLADLRQSSADGAIPSPDKTRLYQTIDLLQQVQAAVGQVLDARDIWERHPPVMTEGASGKSNASSYNKRRTEQLRQQREQLERLRPLLAQASASLLHGIIVQSRTVPSMTIQIGTAEVPLDAEEDRDPRGLNDAQAFAGDL